MDQVLLGGGREDQDIVEVNKDKALCDLVLEGLGHHLHEGTRGVGEAEGKYQELEEALGGGERGLVYILGRDSNLMVARGEVQLGEKFGALQLVEELVDAGKGGTCS